MILPTTYFIKSAPDLSYCPPDQGKEVAFIGRSNAGKSSALNAITGVHKLARTSKTPGRTQLINFFGFGNEQQRLVDLPGYGYAKVSTEVKQQWGQALDEYLRERKSLQGLILIMDIRHPLTSFDRQMLDWTQHCQLPVHILLTKADKLNRGPAQQALAATTKQLATFDSVSIQLFSAIKGTGLEAARARLSTWLS